MQYLAVLGRQPEISLAELQAQFKDVHKISNKVAIFKNDQVPDTNRFGGTLKFAKLLTKMPFDYLISLPEGKITLGVSDYSKKPSKKRAENEALKLKRTMKKRGRNVRVVPNKTPELSTATSHHNQLGEKPRHVELILVEKTWYLSLGAQNITAYAKRDQARPARDAKVGMLPPKLAQILINLCGPLKPGARVLDPFCGTGVVLQEAALMGYTPYGTDLSERMVEYSKKNLAWLASTAGNSANISPRSARLAGLADRAIPPVNTGVIAPVASGNINELPAVDVSQGDATSYTWSAPIDAVACETYLGPPMSTPPVDIKLKTAKQECQTIILGFLKNISTQITPGTPLVLAIPAWLRPDNTYSHLNILDEIANLGYNVEKNFGRNNLLYARTGQVVAREIIILRKK